MKKKFQQEVPLNTKYFYKLKKLASSSTLQMAWIYGYFFGHAAINKKKIVQESSKLVSITLLSASQTGNARRLAEQLRDDLILSNLPVVLINTGEYKFKQIAKEKIFIIISSTQGFGEPPEEAVAFYKYLLSPKAPLLQNTYFAVFGLGDSYYEKFYKICKYFDRSLAELGAHRLYDRVDADVDYQYKADCWRIEIVKILKSYFINNQQLLNNNSNLIEINNFIVYKKDKPFSANIISNKKITSRSSFKDIRHIELDISNSGLKYQPGDALGVWYENDPMLIKELIELLCLKENEKVQVDGKSMVLSEALRKNFDLTQNTPSIVSNYAVLTKNKKLLSFVTNKDKLQYFAKLTPIVDMVYYAPTRLKAQQLLNLLRPLTPRIYSIASSQAIVGEEVHITVGVVRYEIDGRARTGGASGYLADLVDGDKVNIFIEKNDNFRLPEDHSVPIIMIGPGTGIAPFRAFMQQRDADSAKGKNWIFFCNQHFIDDFIYQLEWKNYFKSGLLTKIDLAWSRDQHKKIYVQDILIEKSSEVWNWIKQGAYIYVCGDATNMARDIDKTLLNIVSKYGDMGKEQADEFLIEMRIERRYQLDVY